MEHRVKFPQPPFTKGGRGGIIIVASVVRPTLLCISSEAVIPAPYQVRGRLSQAWNDNQSKGFFDAAP